MTRATPPFKMLLFFVIFALGYGTNNLEAHGQSSGTTTPLPAPARGTAEFTNDTDVVDSVTPPPEVFSPIVTATCRTGVMTIKVETLNNFVGVVHSRDYRKPECSGYGENSKVTFLRINMHSEKNDKDYCGVFYSQPNSEERSVAIAVRTHRTLELVDDKFYMITCGKAGFQNSRNQTSLVNLQLRRHGKKVDQVVYGREYILRADISHPDGQFGMKVKRCFSFSDTNNTVQLVDDKGCPDTNIISEFTYDREQGVAEAKIASMFKFPESHRVHFQCDILVCRDDCDKSECAEGDYMSNSDRARSLKDPSADALFLQPAEDGALMASYSVFVVEPGSDVDVESLCSDCSGTGPHPKWLLYLCIVFGILFLLMLIVNVFLCSAMTCSCARTDIVDKEPSMIEEFDPYTRSWHGSQYGSRLVPVSSSSTLPSTRRTSAASSGSSGSLSATAYHPPFSSAFPSSSPYGTMHQHASKAYSLSGGIKPIPPPLISVDTSHSISSSAASDYGGGPGSLSGGGGPGLPAVYGVPVHSRPASRYSNRSHRSHRSARQPRAAQQHSSSSGTSTHYSKYSNGRMIN